MGIGNWNEDENEAGYDRTNQTKPNQAITFYNSTCNIYDFTLSRRQFKQKEQQAKHLCVLCVTKFQISKDQRHYNFLS